MKILCLLIVLANIFLLMWEYRAGAFTDRKTSQEQPALAGKEQILLVGEQIKPSQPQTAQSESKTPENKPINETSSQPEIPQPQSP
jgi:hypothetical protein